MSYKICEKRKVQSLCARKKKRDHALEMPPSPASPVISNGPPLSEMAKFDTRGLFPRRKEDPSTRKILEGGSS